MLNSIRAFRVERPHQLRSLASVVIFKSIVVAVYSQLADSGQTPAGQGRFWTRRQDQSPSRRATRLENKLVRRRASYVIDCEERYKRARPNRPKKPTAFFSFRRTIERLLQTLAHRHSSTSIIDDSRLPLSKKESIATKALNQPIATKTNTSDISL